MASIARAAQALHAELQCFEAAFLTGDECAALVASLARVERACAAARVEAAARAVACGSHAKEGPGSPADWLARWSSSPSGRARAELDTIALAESRPATREALRRGDISLTAAYEIVRTDDVAPGSEQELLAVAQRERLHVLKDRARRRRLERIKPDELRQRQQSARMLRHWTDDLGMFRFDGALLPEDGAAFLSRLEAEGDRLWRADATRRSDVRQQRHADAFVRLVEGKGKGQNRRADVVVVVDSRKLIDGDDADGPCHVIGGGPIPVAIARSIADDAFLKVVLHDGVDIQKVVHVGRYQPAELRTALLLGPPPDFEGVVCAEEGCGRQLGVEWDHIVPVASGGLTTIWNERPNCGPHHKEKTERDRRGGLLGPGGRRGPPR
jgi:hypothetical protein